MAYHPKENLPHLPNPYLYASVIFERKFGEFTDDEELEVDDRRTADVLPLLTSLNQPLFSQSPMSAKSLQNIQQIQSGVEGKLN